jgi:3-hydroxyisobutyrate dehydrogenase
MLQDMGLATEIGTSSGSPLPLAEAAENIYAEMLKQHPDLGRKDFSSVYLFLRQAAEKGKKVRFGAVTVQ